LTVWRIAVTREMVHRITRIVLVDVDESGIHGENVERGLTEGLPVGQEMVIIEIDDNVGAIEVVKRPLVRVGIVE
jgi:hypothetical protein